MTPAPLDDPLSYPGPAATAPFRLRGEELAPFAGPLPAGRHPVLGIGSNACPAQLAVKFRGATCSRDVLGFPVRVTGLRVRPSAHLGRSGYWPFAPLATAGAETTAVLCLFDVDQLAVLDATEPNYLRVGLGPMRHSITGAPEALGDARVEVYASRHGVVDDPRLPSWSDPPPSQTMLLSVALRALRDTGTELPPGVDDPVALSHALRTTPGLAARLTQALQRALVVREDGLGAGRR